MWSSLPAEMQRHLYMTDKEFEEEIRQADRMTEHSRTGGRLLGEGGGFQSAGRTGRGVVFQAGQPCALTGC